MTGLGLAVAIPAVMAYNICVRQNRTLSNALQDHAHELLIDTILPEQKTAVLANESSTSKHVQYAGGQA